MTDTIKNFPNRLHRMTQVFYREVPSQVAARRFVDSLANLLFPVRDRRGMSLNYIFFFANADNCRFTKQT